METRSPNPSPPAGARPTGATGAAPHNDPDRAANDLKQAGGAIREQARSATEQIKGGATEIGRQAKDKAAELADQTRRKASDYAQQARAQAATMLDAQRTRAADGIHTLGAAVQRAADKFREEHDDNIAGYVDAAADEVRRLGDYLERRDLSSLWRDAQSFGRRRPELFLGGMFVAGLALTRFLKASAERREPQWPHQQTYRGNEGVAQVATRTVPAAGSTGFSAPGALDGVASAAAPATQPNRPLSAGTGGATGGGTGGSAASHATTVVRPSTTSTHATPVPGAPPTLPHPTDRPQTTPASRTTGTQPEVL